MISGQSASTAGGASLTSERHTPWLDLLWLEVTAKCNLRCVHCYSESGPQRRLHEHMSPEDWEDALDQAATLGCRAVQFIGGEPTMYPALPALIERARVLGFDTIEVYTNGTTFKPRIKDALLRHRVNLAFSVYAADSETHDRVTQREGSFESTLASIQWALESDLCVRAGIIEMDANAGQAQQAKERLQEMGVRNIGIDRARGVGRGANEYTAASPFDELCGACWRGKLAITAAGQIFPCVFSRFCQVGHVDQGLKTVLEGIPLHAFRHRMQQERAQLIADCNPDTCGPDTCAPTTHCTPQECSPVVGCRPDQVCNPDTCRPSGCTPSECIPATCSPPIHCRPDAD